MTTTHEAKRVKHSTAVQRARIDPSASDRLRKQAVKVTEDVKEMGGIATDAAREELEHFRDGASE